VNEAPHHPAARIGLISNAGSGHNRDQFSEIKELLDSCDNVYHLETSCVEDIPEALRRFSERDIEILAINGGDGTVSAILGCAMENRIFPRLPSVVLLPGGTANMNAGDIGSNGKLLPAVQRFCTWAKSGAEGNRGHTQRCLMRVQLGTETKPHYGMFLGMGAVIQGTEYAHENIHSRGLRDDISVAVGTARTVWGLFRGDPRFSHPLPVQVCLDHASSPDHHNALILVVSSLQRLALGMKPFWGSGPGPLRLTLIEENSYKFLRTFVSIVRGRPNRHATEENGYFSYNAGHISLGMTGSLNLDGEILQNTDNRNPITISASEPVTFLRV
jgi:diacylglycerol kinase (ATP)